MSLKRLNAAAAITGLLLCAALAQAQDAPLGSEAWRAGLRDRVAQAIQDLASEEFDRRDAASRSLLALAEFCEADLDAELAKSADPEAAARLQGLIDARAQVHEFVVRTLLPEEPFSSRNGEAPSIPSDWTEAILTHRLVLRGVVWSEIREDRLAPALRTARPELAQDALVLRLSDPSTPVRAGACWVLGELGVREAAPVLRRRLRDLKRSVRTWAARALFRIADPEMADLLFDDATFATLLEDDLKELRGLRGEWLVRLNERRGLAAVVGALEGRPAAGEDLGLLLQQRLKGEALSAEDLAACERLIEGDFPRSLQAAAASILVERRGGDPRERLRAGMAHRCPEVRSRTVGSALSRCDLGDEELIVAARSQLDDPDRGVRDNAVRHCLELGDIGVLDRVLARVEPADEAALRFAVGMVVSRDRTGRFAGRTIELLEHATVAQLWSWFSPSSYDETARYWKGDDRADDLLWRRLVKECDPPRTRDYLATASQLLAPGAFAHALELLDSSDPVTHHEAAGLLLRLKPATAPPDLDRFVGAHDPMGRIAAEVLIDGGRGEVVRARIPGWLADDDTRWYALWAIERLHATEWAPELRRLLAKGDPHWRVDLVRALAALDDRESLPAMCEAYLDARDLSNHKLRDLPGAALRIGGKDQVIRWIHEALGVSTETKKEQIARLCVLLGKEGIGRLKEMTGEDDDELLSRLDSRYPDQATEIVLELWPLSARACDDHVWLALARTGNAELYGKVLADARTSHELSSNLLFRVLQAYVGQDGVEDAIALLEADPQRHHEAFLEVFRETEDPRLDEAMRTLWKALSGDGRRGVMEWLQARKSVTPERWELLKEMERDCASEHLYWLRAAGRAWRARQP